VLHLEDYREIAGTEPGFTCGGLNNFVLLEGSEGVLGDADGVFVFFDGGEEHGWIKIFYYCAL
jgi:hypothetical protein